MFSWLSNHGEQMTLVRFYRGTEPGSAPDPRQIRPRGIAVNVTDRRFYYLDDRGNLAQWDASAMPDDLWDRFSNGFEVKCNI
jgi:hypothetical protein